MPFPTLHDIIVSSELLIFLWPLRWLQRLIESDVSKRRRQIIINHVKHHTGKMRKCRKDSCNLLTEVLPAGHF